METGEIISVTVVCVLLGAFVLFVVFSFLKGIIKDKEDKKYAAARISPQDELEKQFFVQILDDLKELHECSPLESDSLVCALADLYEKYNVVFPNVRYCWAYEEKTDKQAIVKKRRIDIACRKLKKQQEKLGVLGCTSNVLWRNIWNDYSPFHPVEHPLHSNPELLFYPYPKLLKQNRTRYYNKNGKEVFPQTKTQKSYYYRIKYNLVSRRMEAGSSLPVAMLLINNLVVELTKSALKTKKFEYSKDRYRTVCAKVQKNLEDRKFKLVGFEKACERRQVNNPTHNVTPITTFGMGDANIRQVIERKYYSEVLNKLKEIDENSPLLGDNIVEAIIDLYRQYDIVLGHTFFEEYAQGSFTSGEDKKREIAEDSLNQWFEYVNSAKGIASSNPHASLLVRIYGSESNILSGKQKAETAKLLCNYDTNKVLFFCGETLHKECFEISKPIPYTSSGSLLDCSEADNCIAIRYNIKTKRALLYEGSSNNNKSIHPNEIPALLIDDLVIQLTARELDSIIS